VSAVGKKPAVRFLAPVSLCAFAASWTPRPGTTVQGQFPIPPIATSDGAAGTASAWLAGVSLAKGPNVACRSADGTKYERLGSLQVDNVFVWCNLLHDRFAAFGFDSNHHSFEADDPLQAFRHTIQNLAGGVFDNWVDGVKPQLNVYESPFVGGRHAGEDPSILVHEYVHGVSSRLVGGEQCQYPFATRQAQGFSEGSSDYFAITVLNYLDRSRGGAGTITRFAETFRPGGIRDYSNHQGSWSAQLSDPYQIGMVWCAGLLDARQAVAGLTDADAADRFIWQACVDCLKLMAPECSTSLDLTLTHAKDALVGAMSALEQRPAVRRRLGRDVRRARQPKHLMGRGIDSMSTTRALRFLATVFCLGRAQRTLAIDQTVQPAEESSEVQFECLPRPPNQARVSGYHVYEENDSIIKDGGDDRYTQGLRLAFNFHRSAVACPFQKAGHWLKSRVWPKAEEFKTGLSLVVGQNLYTPRIITSRALDANDLGFSDFTYLSAELSLTSTDRAARHVFDASIGALGHEGLGKGGQGGNARGITGQLVARKGLAKGFNLGLIELSSATVEGAPTRGEPGNRSDIILRQRAVTLGWGTGLNQGKGGPDRVSRRKRPLGRKRPDRDRLPPARKRADGRAAL
jgi:hypothetical protein